MNKNITILFQGENKKFNIKNDFFYIISTWGSNSTTIYLNYIVVRTTDIGPIYNFNNRENNVLRQILSTQRGICHCNTPYILKIRTDCSIENYSMMNNLQKTRKTQYTFFKEKMRITNFFVRNYLKAPYLFHISDCVLFGRTDDMCALWGDTLPTPESLFCNEKYFSFFGNNVGITMFREVPEQTITIQWLKRMGININLQHPSSSSYQMFKLWENILVENFEIIDAEKSGIRFPKHFYDKDKHHETLLTANDFEKIKKNPGSKLRYTCLLLNKYIYSLCSVRYWLVTIWLLLYRISPNFAQIIRHQITNK